MAAWPTRSAAPAQIGSFASWANLANADALSKLAPTLAATALLMGTMKLAPLCGGAPLLDASRLCMSFPCFH